MNIKNQNIEFNKTYQDLYMHVHTGSVDRAENWDCSPEELNNTDNFRPVFLSADNTTQPINPWNSACSDDYQWEEIE